jgi:hypothetical protein
MSKALQKKTDAANLDVTRRLMNDALARLGQTEISRSSAKAAAPGRLIVVLDLTGSRSGSLEQARIATTAMFEAIKCVGSVLVKLIYYRGNSECKTSKWVSDPEILNSAMLRLACRTGETQIARALRIANGADQGPVSAVVFIGDHCEDDPDELASLASSLGEKGIPIFVFHECADSDFRSLNAQRVFQCMAETSGGMYCEFKPDSGAVLRDLLASVAAFSAAGSEGVKNIAMAATPTGKLLQQRLFLGAVSKPQEK